MNSSGGGGLALDRHCSDSRIRRKVFRVWALSQFGRGCDVSRGLLLLLDGISCLRPSFQKLIPCLDELQRHLCCLRCRVPQIGFFVRIIFNAKQLLITCFGPIKVFVILSNQGKNSRDVATNCSMTSRINGIALEITTPTKATQSNAKIQSKCVHHLEKKTEANKVTLRWSF